MLCRECSHWRSTTLSWGLEWVGNSFTGPCVVEMWREREGRYGMVGERRERITNSPTLSPSLPHSVDRQGWDSDVWQDGCSLFPAFAVLSAHDWLESCYSHRKMGQVACGEQCLYGQTDSTNMLVYIPTHASHTEKDYTLQRSSGGR